MVVAGDLTGIDVDALLDRMNALTLEVILRVVFGVTDEQRLAERRERAGLPGEFELLRREQRGGIGRLERQRADDQLRPARAQRVERRRDAVEPGVVHTFDCRTELRHSWKLSTGEEGTFSQCAEVTFIKCADNSSASRTLVGTVAT